MPGIGLYDLEPVPLPLSRTPSDHLYLREITLRPFISYRGTGNYMVPRLRATIWTEFSEAALQLQHLRVINFDFANLRTLEDFLDMHFTSLSGLHAAGKSIYSYPQKGSSGYYAKVSVKPMAYSEER